MNYTALHQKINALPEPLKLEVSDFVDFLLSRLSKMNRKTPDAAPKPGRRRIGLLEGKASFAIREDFEMTDEEFLSS